MATGPVKASQGTCTLAYTRDVGADVSAELHHDELAFVARSILSTMRLIQCKAGAARSS
jgi:hypothetical protein